MKCLNIKLTKKRALNGGRSGRALDFSLKGNSTILVLRCGSFFGGISRRGLIQDETRHSKAKTRQTPPKKVSTK